MIHRITGKRLQLTVSVIPNLNTPVFANCEYGGIVVKLLRDHEDELALGHSTEALM